MKSVLYITYDGLSDPLGGSQIIPYIIGLAARGWVISILSCEKPERLKAHGTRIRALLGPAGVSWHPLAFHRFPPVAAKFWDQAMLIREARRLHAKNPFSIVHCRSYVAMEAGIRLKEDFGVRLLFDMRGFWVDERVEGGLWNLRNPFFLLAYAVYKRREKAFLRAADEIVILTQKGKAELSRWPAYGGVPISVIPCAVDFASFHLPLGTDRERALRELGIPGGAFVLLYLGSLGTWYMLDEMLAFFAALNAARPESVFLFLTPDPTETVLQAGRRRGVDPSALRIRATDRSELPALLAAADAGISFIRPSYSKIASSPTKIGELLAVGLPIISNTGIGDIDVILPAVGGGILIDNLTSSAFEAVLPGLRVASTAEREEVRRKSREWYDLQTAVVSYDRIYRNLAAVEGHPPAHPELPS